MDQLAIQTGWRDLLAQQRWTRFALIMLGIWLMAADSMVTTTIMPSVGRDLNGYLWFGWATSGYLVGLVVAGACAGWLAARFGLRMAMVGAGVVLALGCAITAFGASMASFIAGRMVQGVAAGWVSGLCYVAIGMVFPERHLARVFAAATAVWGVATLVGPLVGGVFADAGQWRWVFLLFGVQALLFVLATIFLIPADGDRLTTPPVPYKPLIVVSAGVVTMAAAGVTDHRTTAMALVILGVVMLGVALWADRREAFGLLPRAASQWGSPISAAYLCYFMATAASIGYSIYGPAILQQINGLTSIGAGYVIAVEALAWTATALLVAGAGNQWSRRWIIIGNLSIVLACGLMIPVMSAGNLAWVLLAGGLLGAGFGLSFSFISTAVMVTLTEDDRATGSAAIGSLRNAGGATGGAIASVAANLNGFSDKLPNAQIERASMWIFLTTLPLAVIGLYAAVRLVKLLRREER